MKLFTKILGLLYFPFSKYPRLITSIGSLLTDIARVIVENLASDITAMGYNPFSILSADINLDSKFTTSIQAEIDR